MTESDEFFVIVDRRGSVPLYWSWGNPGRWTEKLAEARQYSRQANARIAIQNLSVKSGLNPKDVLIESIS